MSQVGRISGPLLFANLERNGIDLKISNTSGSSPILKFDVTNNRIGIGTETPISDLQVPNSFNTTNLIATGVVNVADFTLVNNQINVNSGDIEIDSGSIIEASSISTDAIKIEENNIYGTTSNEPIELIPSANKEHVISGDRYYQFTSTENQSPPSGSDFTMSRFDGFTYAYMSTFDSSETIGLNFSSAEFNTALQPGRVPFDANDYLKIENDDIIIVFQNTGTSVYGGPGRFFRRPWTLIYSSLDTYDIQGKTFTITRANDYTALIEYKTDIQSNLDVDENLHATGNITFGGTITLGGDADDDITFAAEVASNIIPDLDETLNLGLENDNDSTYQRFGDLHAFDINTRRARANSILIDGKDYGLATGNSFYVDPNGDDANRGDHPQAPFRTLKHALAAVDSSASGMTTINIHAGEYEEEFPLTVPANTNVMGSGFREVVIKPTQGTNNEDCFLLTGETTVANLTIKDFFYDSGNDKGYGFRFANNAITTTRSPYIQNISVITKGSVTSASDPRGFDQGDAGRGALVDGSALDSNSVQSSMLFHSVTFLTAGAIGLRMKDGVRVEWLNSFTYFADIGLKAENGTTGFVSPHDGSTRNFGAELRSIGSANVYGNKGAVADGNDCLMYLIQHNMAYIGTGKSKENDKTLVNRTNEIEKLNSGRIYFQTTDERGRFQVGDSFFADFDTGTTSIDADTVAFDTLSEIRITTGTETTFIDGSRVDVGNFVLSGNKLSTSTGDMNFDSITNVVMNSNVNMKGTLDIFGNINIGRNFIRLGDGGNDTITFNVDFDQDLFPATSGVHSLGSAAQTWKELYASQLFVDDIRIFDNVITTQYSNSDLELYANGTGRIRIENNNVQAGQNLQVDGNTTIPSLSTTGTFTHTGDININQSYNVTGDVTVENITIPRDVALKEFDIRGNKISGTVTNQDINLQASGTGRISIPKDDVVIQNNLTVRDATTGAITFLDEIDASQIDTGNIEVATNFITTTQSNSDLELRAAGTGNVKIENLEFTDGDSTANEIFTASGALEFTPADTMIIDSSTALDIPIGTDATRRNTQGDIRFNRQKSLFEAYDTSVVTLGGVYSDDQRTFVNVNQISNNYIDFHINNTKVGTINSAQVEMPGLATTDILINNAKITTTSSDSDLLLETQGTGEVKILTMPDTNITDNIIDNTQSFDSYNTSALTIAVSGNGYQKITDTWGMRIPVGTDSNRGSNPQVGETRYNTDQQYMESWDGNLWVVSAGGGGATVSEEEMEQLILEYSLALG